MKRNGLHLNLGDRFTDFADWIAWFLGTPMNIILWIILVAAWFWLFATNPELQNTTFLPNWFTSNAFNFPLNTITTLAELYIGFFMLASANRNDRVSKALHAKLAIMAEHTERLSQHIEEQEENELQVLNGIGQTLASISTAISNLTVSLGQHEVRRRTKDKARS